MTNKINNYVVTDYKLLTFNANVLKEIHFITESLFRAVSDFIFSNINCPMELNECE